MSQDTSTPRKRLNLEESAKNKGKSLLDIDWNDAEPIGLLDDES